MSLAADVEWMLPQLRAQAEGLMTATCRIGDSSITTDPTTLEPVTTFNNVIYEGKCRVRDESAANNTVDAGTQDVAVQTLVLSLPVQGSEQVHTGHSVQILSNPHDGALVEGTFRISGFHAQTYSTARRFPIEVVT